MMIIIKELCEALAPIKVAVEALSSEDADILLAEKAIDVNDVEKTLWTRN